eukprot:CAMPEP_0170624480 /NCGR_PEP_ID=MMETSP0224-20130122/30252_1 /TAXON_ID=285029 /ORGANISM="Togula jolla, Strain CCCM 725" /LENGTH=484 /DNA_ID=CAMNT_0010950999 /DNA_START=70 /DNA_END=1524 /DNA_ORIENTATION=+
MSLSLLHKSPALALTFAFMSLVTCMGIAPGSGKLPGAGNSPTSGPAVPGTAGWVSIESTFPTLPSAPWSNDVSGDSAVVKKDHISTLQAAKATTNSSEAAKKNGLGRRRSGSMTFMMQQASRSVEIISNGIYQGADLAFGDNASQLVTSALVAISVTILFLVGLLLVSDSGRRPSEPVVQHRSSGAHALAAFDRLGLRPLPRSGISQWEAFNSMSPSAEPPTPGGGPRRIDFLMNPQHQQPKPRSCSQAQAMEQPPPGSMGAKLLAATGDPFPSARVEVPPTSSGDGESIAPASAPSVNVAPPALCPALVLPQCEAWFAVSVEKLMEGIGSFDVLGLSGNPLLRANVRHSQGGGRTIEVSMMPGNPMLASIGTPTEASCGPGVLEVRNSTGWLYGYLKPTARREYALVCDDKTVLTLNSDDHGRLVLCAAGSSSPLARASKGMEGGVFVNAEHLQVRVDPGVDAVLMLCCVLAVVLFGGGADLP